MVLRTPFPPIHHPHSDAVPECLPGVGEPTVLPVVILSLAPHPCAPSPDGRQTAASSRAAELPQVSLSARRRGLPGGRTDLPRLLPQGEAHGAAQTGQTSRAQAGPGQQGPRGPAPGSCCRRSPCARFSQARPSPHQVGAGVRGGELHSVPNPIPHPPPIRETEARPLQHVQKQKQNARTRTIGQQRGCVALYSC